MIWDLLPISRCADSAILNTSATTTFDIGPQNRALPDLIFNVIAGTGAGANAGTINLISFAYLVVTGTFRNTGSINDTGDAADIQVDEFLTLTGAGRVRLNGSGIIIGGTLTNEDNYISGNGEILFSGNFPNETLVNAARGTIEASGGGTLQIDQGNVTNAGTIQATAATLFIAGPIANSGLILAANGNTVTLANVSNSKTGVLQADGAGSQVIVADLVGGTLRTSSSGIIVCYALDGTGVHPVTNLGDLVMPGDGPLSGTIHNKGLSVVRDFETGGGLN
jgi:hypothetical protein